MVVKPVKISILVEVMQHYFTVMRSGFYLPFVSGEIQWHHLPQGEKHRFEPIPSVHTDPVNQPETTKLATLGEFGLIARITAQVVRDDSVITGIGDDAAVTRLSSGMQLLTSTDMLLEDVHFRHGWHDPYHLGRKSLAVSISDIAAMGGIPRWCLLSLAIPPTCPLEVVDGFMGGFLALAAEHGVTLIGGDTCSSRAGLTISVTIMGEQFPDRIIRRAGARPDDDIWVTGTLGDAALGLRLAERNLSAATHSVDSLEELYLLSRLRDPTPRVSAALHLAESVLISSMIDISDGILADFGHIAESSGVGGMLYVDDLPLSAQLCSVAPSLSVDPRALALSGGEDYELCFTSPVTQREKIELCMKKCGVEATRIGIVTDFMEVHAVTRDGVRYSVNNDGFNHFR